MLEIKGFDCTDIKDETLPWTELPRSFAIPFCFRIGEVGSDAADNYEFVVYSPDRLREIGVGYGYAVLPILDVALVVALVDRLVKHSNTLNDPQEFLARELSWEFGNYR